MKILLIGAGQIGSRHLQGLAMLNQSAKSSAKIFVVDPSLESLKVAKQRFQDVNQNNPLPEMIFETDLSNLKMDFDFAIIATDAKRRRRVLEDVLSNRKVKYIILEKVLFQKKTDYHDVLALLKKNNTQAWVNCPMRIWPGYQQLKKLLQQNNMTNKTYKMNLTGGGWGLACNAIHYIDLFCYLTGLLPTHISTECLDPAIMKSKRDGFFELTGELVVHFAGQSRMNISCDKDSQKPIQITIESADQRHIIREDLKACWSSNLAANWQIEKWDLQMPYQSQLTGQIILDIIEKNTTDLPTYEQSMLIHLPMIDSFINYFSTRMNIEENGELVCPIT